MQKVIDVNHGSNYVWVDHADHHDHAVLAWRTDGLHDRIVARYLLKKSI